ncbi:amino acid adenylation domain-containing protein [Oscillatoria sp. CS-180]|uniref:non-ribosomal peptide synthetase n=1 Tax=Oscillatoria sp. CS-180 TaxID=3021720 RepID=UPI00232F05F2|nr:non-ribosomal peptide synthetase [Oscillatoria sp. CS-180]MDB9527414.1 amino acid adenylation domain-containing protein [Oscillatoria sp. CS-180]
MIDVTTHSLTVSEKQALLRLRLQQKGIQVPETTQISRRSADEEIPLSFAQQRLWTLDHLQGTQVPYLIPSALRLQGELDRSVLQQVVDVIVQRHDILRTRFVTVEGIPQQQINKTLRLALPLIDVQGLSANQQTEAIAHLMQAATTQHFDLAEGPLLRLQLIQLDAQQHVLLAVLHHIIADGWSIGIFIKEIGAIYTALSEHRPIPLPELSLQYADFACWQRQWLTGDRLRTQLKYWQQQLAEAPALLELPTDHPRPVRQSFRGQTQSFHLDRPLTEALEQLSRTTGTTLFMVLLAGLATLLARYSRQSLLVIGTPVANRTRQELEPLIGFFVNVLALPIKTTGNPSFQQLLERVKAVTLGGYAHQDVPFEQVVEALQPERSLSYSPLFQVMLVLQNAPSAEWSLPALTLSSLEFAHTTTKFDLTLTCNRSEAGLTGSWEYSTDLFESATIARMTQQFQTLLREIVAQPDQGIDCIPLLQPQDRQQLLTLWSGDENSAASRDTVLDLFAYQVAQRPDAVAAVMDDSQLSYRVLNQQANQLAHWLQMHHSVGPEVRVGLCLERSLEQVIGAIAILKAGGTYVPLEPSYPPERLAWLVEDADVAVVVTQAAGQARLPAGIPMLIWEQAKTAIAQAPKTDPAMSLTPDHLAYLMYTSGSTGQPKGVSITHAGIVRLVSNPNYVELLPSDRGLQLAPLAFDASTFEIWGMLLTGACLVIMPPGLPSLAALIEVLERQHITTLWLSAGLFHLMVEQCLTDVRSLRYLLAGGDVLSIPHLQQAQQQLPTTRLVNGYGPTENTTFTCCYTVTNAAALHTSVPIGQPVAQTQVYLLDAQLQPVPVGVPGELYTGGAGLARGYHRQPALTAAAFVPHPFSTQPGARLYRTGDLARYQDDGTIEFLGRRDQQVKIRGFRIEPAEIEAALARHSQIRQALVMPFEASPGVQALVGYGVPVPGEAPSVAELRAFLKSSLPDYLVPSIILLLDQLPLTPNGKVDRRQLPSPTAATPSETPFVAPTSPVEQTLCEIWQELLGIASVGIHDNFFELGGDSILAIQGVARATQRGYRLTPQDLFLYQTIAELAPVVDTVSHSQAEQGLVSGEVPLTPIQCWFFQQQLSCPHHFNQAVLLQVPVDVDAGLLQRAIAYLTHHHDSLRLRFTTTAGKWRQAYTPPADNVLTCLDLSNLQTAEQVSALEATAAQLQASLNLAAGPLLRIALFQLGGDRGQRLLIILHHLVVDGVSWRILLEDLATIYGQLSQGNPIGLPPKTTAFKTWSEQLWIYAQGASLKAEIPFWQQQEQISAELPVDIAGGSPSSHPTVANTAEVTGQLDEATTHALLQRVPAVYNTQITDILLTALARSLAPWLQTDTVRLDMEGHGRETVGTEMDVSRTVGWFTSLYPLGLHVDIDSSPIATLKAIKEQLRQVPKRGVGYGVWRYLAADQDGQTETSAVSSSISFNYLGQLDRGLSGSAPWSLAPEKIGSLQNPRQRRLYGLEISGYISGGRLHLKWRYSPTRHRRQTIEHLSNTFIAALTELIEHCLLPQAGGFTPSDFPLAPLTQASLDWLSAALPQLVDLYPLAPMQLGLLFHAIYTPEAGTYVNQINCTLRGALNVGAFQQAWQQVVDRHAALRTSFHWEALESPLQAVHRNARLPWHYHDWRSLPSTEQQRRLTACLQADQQATFVLNQAPLMRCTLIQLSEETYRFIWSFHHLLIDGWSLPQVLGEVVAAYTALRQGKSLHWPRPRSYRDYVVWLQQQDMNPSETFWRRMLRGLTIATPLPNSQIPTPAQTGQFTTDRSTFDPSLVKQLMAMARSHHLTLNTLIQGAWAVLLGDYSDRADVTFGVTVAGRPPTLSGVETMIGLFINTLPLRIAISADQSLLAWLQQLQANSVEQSQYAYTPLVEIQGWSDIPRGMPLFESVVVFENYPTGPALALTDQDIALSDVESMIWNHFPLTLRFGPSNGLSLTVLYDQNRLTATTVNQLKADFEILFTAFLTQPEGTLAEWRQALHQRRQAQQNSQAEAFDAVSRQTLKTIRRRSPRG